MDGETLFMRCSAWGEQSENIANELSRGQGVIVTGKMKQRRSYEKDGAKHTVIELEVDEIGRSLKFADKFGSATTRSSDGGEKCSATTSWPPR